MTQVCSCESIESVRQGRAGDGHKLCRHSSSLESLFEYPRQYTTSKYYQPDEAYPDQEPSCFDNHSPRQK